MKTNYLILEGNGTLKFDTSKFDRSIGDLMTIEEKQYHIVAVFTDEAEAKQAWRHIFQEIERKNNKIRYQQRKEDNSFMSKMIDEAAEHLGIDLFDRDEVKKRMNIK